jgi:hypothetical protein
VLTSLKGLISHERILEKGYIKNTYQNNTGLFTAVYVRVNVILLCCIIHKNRYKTTTLAILKNGPNTNYSILVESFKFS